MELFFAALLGFALGSIPFGLILTRAAGLGDVRQIGSGSIGATNVLRTGNKGLAAATVLLDAAKAAIPVLVAKAAGPLVAALMFTATGNYNGVLVLLIATGALAAALLWIATRGAAR
jgi:glycerol-3-phosphate acyltransferase PlsY